MKNRRILITEDERERILRMHENHAKRNNLNFGRVQLNEGPSTTMPTNILDFQRWVREKYPERYMGEKDPWGYGPGMDNQWGNNTQTAWDDFGEFYEKEKQLNVSAGGGGRPGDNTSNYLRNVFTTVFKTNSDMNFDPTTMVIKDVPGGKIFLLEPNSHMNLNAWNKDQYADETGKFDTSKLKLTGEYVNAKKYALQKDQVSYDDGAATGASIPPEWYTDNGNVYSVVVYDGIAYGTPNNTNFKEDFKLTGNPVDPTPMKGVPPTTPQQTEIGGGGSQQQTDQEETTALNDLKQVTQEFNQGKKDLRKLKKVKNQLERVLKRKDKFMDDKTKQTYQNSITDLDNKIKQLGG